MANKFQTFEMERMMSKWENVVDFNLSESGAHPITLKELIAGSDQLEKLLALEINYPQANGIIELRKNISKMYPGSNSENVLVTVGAIEANYLTIQTLLEPGDEIAVMIPNYMQIWGIAKNMGLCMKTFKLDENDEWKLNLADSVNEKTKLIAVCNPNNPTGHILSENEREEIINAADRVGAWILADEVYSGAERIVEDETESMWGHYDKVLAVGSVSKAYGIPGLRIGWAVGPVSTIDELWARHEYFTISATMLSNHLAAYALSDEVRPRLINRTRNYIRKGYPVLEEWMQNNGDIFRAVPPQAAAVAFIKYNLDINSTHLTERLMKEKSVLVIPGDHFGYDNYFRISFGLPHDFLKEGLKRIDELVHELV